MDRAAQLRVADRRALLFLAWVFCVLLAIVPAVVEAIVFMHDRLVAAEDCSCEERRSQASTAESPSTCDVEFETKGSRSTRAWRHGKCWLFFPLGLALWDGAAVGVAAIPFLLLSVYVELARSFRRDARNLELIGFAFGLLVVGTVGPFLAMRMLSEMPGEHMALAVIYLLGVLRALELLGVSAWLLSL